LRQFGPGIVAEKRDALLDFVERTVALFPAIKARHPTLGLVVYPVSRTPFVVLYDYDDDEVRINFILHRRASLDELDPASVDW
jgi:hypothetical protein